MKHCKTGDTVEYLEDVSSPAPMAGTKGQTKVVGKDITLYYADRMMSGSNILLKVVAKPVPAKKPTPKPEPEPTKAPAEG